MTLVKILFEKSGPENSEFWKRFLNAVNLVLKLGHNNKVRYKKRLPIGGTLLSPKIIHFNCCKIIALIKRGVDLSISMTYAHENLEAKFLNFSIVIE